MSEKGGSQSWGSRWGFIISAIGMTIGTGAMWRFPRVAAMYGGMPFMIVLIVTLFLWSIPVLMFEAYLGKTTRLGPIGSIVKKLGQKFAWLGTCYAWITVFLTAYYIVVFGWTIRYLFYAIDGTISPGVDTEALWNNFSTGSFSMVPWWIIGLVACVFVVLRGGSSGIEKLSKIVMPIWFVLLVGLMIRAVTMPNGTDGIRYLFADDWSQFKNPTMWLEAVTQCLWQSAPGLGLMQCYAIYLKKHDDISLNCTLVPFSVTSAALLSGMTVVPTIFALSPDPMAAIQSGNTGMAFIHLTRLLANIPFGRWLAIMFFLSLVIAAYTSSISMVEMTTRVIQDAGVERKKAVISGSILLFVLGIPSALDINFLNNQDWVYGVGVLISSLLLAVAAIKLSPSKIWNGDIGPCSDLNVPGIFKCVYIVPFFFVIIMGLWIYGAYAGDPENWLKWLPIDEFPYTAGTLFWQWGIMLAVAVATNNFIFRVMDKNAEGAAQHVED